MILPYYQVKATSDERTNSLVVRAPENIQSQIKKILEVIDNPYNTKSLEIIKINHIPAQDLSIIIQNLIAYKYKNNPGICIGDNKTNKIIILEETKNLSELKEIILKLDTKIILNEALMIKKLKNANSSQLSNLINSIR